VPDVAVYRWERIVWDARDEPQDEVFEPPDVAVEIVARSARGVPTDDVSPGQSVRSQIRKCQWYVEHGVLIALLFNPDDYSVRRFKPDAEPLLLHGANVIDFGPVLPGLNATVAELFALLRRRG